ncbi:MAG TPA: class I SAM-dependent methyltransferase, partial [Bryobacteraceae bacterium]|nr:class I SAM-dependent methyltransferase [Bryobacteraceae bacterium]
VEASHPQGEASGLGVALPDLLPVLHARDAAEAKVAAIGSVNPRPGGPVNALIQWGKGLIARSLGWFVRDQVDFNRATLAAVGATLESLNEENRTFAAVGNRLSALSGEAEELKDIRVHWLNWHQEWERKLAANEVHLLRGIADLHAAANTRFHDLESTSRERDAAYRESLRLQHAEFRDELRRATEEIQAKMWSALEEVKLHYERLIHNELRVVRQRAQAALSSSQPALAVRQIPGWPPLDYARFADRFRGSEEYVRKNLDVYRPFLAGCSAVLDIGCGRGEFLELMRETGVSARGIDLDSESVGLCRSKGLEATVADLFDFLPNSGSEFDAIFASQVVEHLPPERLPDMVRLCHASLRPNGLLIFETPNPECLAIFATHFYLDPTHTRPVPPPLAVFYLEEAGFGRIEVLRLSPAVNSMPALEELPPGFREAFFGGLDYAVIGRKL